MYYFFHWAWKLWVKLNNMAFSLRELNLKNGVANETTNTMRHKNSSASVYQCNANGDLYSLWDICSPSIILTVLSRYLMSLDVVFLYRFYSFFYVSVICCLMLLQDIVKDDEIKLDWFFKASLINDIVNVSWHRQSKYCKIFNNWVQTLHQYLLPVSLSCYFSVQNFILNFTFEWFGVKLFRDAIIVCSRRPM